jgi:ABC-type phosphate/phosphonate transport system substrate-binding protein
MKSIISLILLLILNTSLFSIDDINRFGFLSHSNNVSHFKDARDSLSNWINDMGISNDLKVYSQFYTSIEELISNYSKNQLDMIVMPLADYYENKDVLRKISKNYWTATFSNEEFTQFYLITQIDSNINSIKDISNKKISLELYDKEPEVWINKLTLLNNKKSIESISSKIIKEGKESTVLLNVFFKKTDLAVVSSETWDDMIKSNPSISKKLKIIEKSEKNNIPFVGFFHKNVQEKKMNDFFKVTGNIEKSVRSEELMTLLKFKKFFKIDDLYLSKMEIYYTEYFELRNRYK